MSIFLRAVCLLAAATSAVQAAEPLFLVSASYQKNVIALCERDGTVIWQHRTDGPEKGHAGHHEIQLLQNGNILYHDDWDVVKEIKLDGTKVWRYRSSDVHAFTRLADGNTMIAESGRNRIITVSPDGKVISQTPLGKDGRGKTRQAEALPNGNILVCAERPGTVTEYATDGKIVWEYPVNTRVYGAVRLKNGNTLIGSGSGNSFLEVTPGQNVVWQIEKQIPDTDIELAWTTCIEELPNGHLILGNCHAGPDNPQLIELDADRKVVWTFNQFELVGNGMACFDYVAPEQAEQIRAMVAALPAE